MSAEHSPATRRIQARLERLELQHLREHAAERADLVEDLQQRLAAAEIAADYWAESYNALAKHLAHDTEDCRAVALTPAGELLVVRTGGAAC